MQLLNDTQFIEQVKETIKFIEELVIRLKPGSASTALKIGVVAPFNFALKQYTNDIVFIPSLFAYGFPR
jgi:hypothetical protein